MHKRLLFVAVCLFVVTPDFAQPQTDEYGKLWQKLLPKLQSAVRLKDEREKLPNSSLFGEDKKSNEKEFDKLLDQAVGILSTSDTQNYRRKILDLQNQNNEINKQIAQYEEKKISASESRPAWKAWEDSKKDYEEKIDSARKSIAANEKKIAAIKEQLREELRELGLDVSSEQLDYLLSTVVGDNSIQVIVAFNNVKALTNQLEELLVKSEENIEIARRYYGMYTVLLEILDHLYGQIINDIDTKYIPQLAGGRQKNGKTEGIIPRTEKLLQSTEKLLAKPSSAKNEQVLSANIRAQKITIEAAHLYQTYLLRQRTDISNAKSRLAPDLAAARNTYETVKVSSELVAMMRSGQNLFDSLRGLQVPELRVFQNLEMKKEFEKLTAQLKAGEKS